MVRVISQDTYDDVVRENMEELEMSAEEAVAEAIAQFEAQGVDLSNIIKDLALSGGQGQHTVCTAVTALKDLQDKWEQQRDELDKQLEALKSECEKDLARRVRAGKEGAYPILIAYLNKSPGCDSASQVSDKLPDSSLTVKVLDTLSALMDTQPDLLDDSGLVQMKRLLEGKPSPAVLASTLRWISTCCLNHEMNRQAIFKAELVSSFQRYLKEPQDRKVLCELLVVLRRLVLDDDIRVEFGKAHDHAREIANHALTPLTLLLKDNVEDASLSSELMLTTASLLVRNEFCQTVAEAGGADALFRVAASHYERAPTAAQALKLIKALAGNDDVKRLLVKSGIAPVVVSLLNRHMSNAAATSLSLSCIAALTLREPEHSKEFVENGAAEAIVDAMKRHPGEASVQKNACWAIRNVVARCREYNDRFASLGAEECLNEAAGRFGAEFGFDVKSALRDLDCEVRLEEQWTGRGVQMLHD